MKRGVLFPGVADYSDRIEKSFAICYLQQLIIMESYWLHCPGPPLTGDIGDKRGWGELSPSIVSVVVTELKGSSSQSQIVGLRRFVSCFLFVHGPVQ